MLNVRQIIKCLVFTAAATATIVAAVPVRATPTENNGIRVLPAPGKVVIDGKTDDWDLSGSIFICDNVETQRNDYAVWVSTMYDRDNLYILARWTDKTPLNNPGQTIADFGWSGDCLQVRFITNPNTPDKLVSVINAWKGIDGKDVVQLDSPLTHHAPWGEDVKPRGAQQAFTINPDGGGYVQEIAMPWKLLTKDGRPLAPGSQMNMTFEPNFTVGIGGRMSIKDNFKAGVNVDRVFTFMNTAEWGPATLAAQSDGKPQPLRLADGRTFSVRMAAGTPIVDWTGLVKAATVPGFIPVRFAMPQDGYISLNIKNGDGQVVRQLLTANFYTKGPHTVMWDGLPTPNLHLSGPPVPAGTYTWSGIYHTGIGLKLRGWAYNSGQVPWDNGPASNWGGDEGVPVAVASDSHGVYLGWTGAEAGRALIAADDQGHVRWGNKRGGSAGIGSLASDGDAVYVLDGYTGASLYKLSSTNGSYLTWTANNAADLSLKDIFGAANPGFDKVDDITASGGKLFLSFSAANKVAVVDAVSGKLEKMLDVPGPTALWAKSVTQLYALSAKSSVVLIDPDDGTTKAALTGLSGASGLTGDSAGNVYVGVTVAGADSPNQVDEYAAGGKLIRTFGRTSGRVQRGPWDSNSLLNVSALAVDRDGKLWAAENADYPKRFSAWDTTSGNIWKEFFGPTLYGGLGGAIDPRDPNVMVGAGCEWRLDPTTGQAKCVSVITRDGDLTSRFATGSNGRLYLFVSPGWNVFGKSPYITIYERLDDGSYRIRGRFRFAHEYDKDGDKETSYWADANGDEIEQPNETTSVPAILQFNNWYMGVAPDMTIYVGRSQFKVAGFTAAGAPLYDLAHPLTLPATDASMKDSQGTDEGLGSADDRLVLYNGNYLANRTTFREFDIASGKMLWSYPNNFVGVHGSHNATGPEVGMIRGAYGVLGTAKLPPPLGNIWIIGTNVGEWHILTQDGYYLTRLFQPDPLKVHFPDQPVPGADMSDAPPGLGGEDFGGSMALGTDGNLYLQAGKTGFWNLGVTGLDSVKAIPGGEVSVSADDIAKAQTIREAQLQVAAGSKIAIVKRATPVFTGALISDFRGSDILSYSKGEDSGIRSAAAFDDRTLSVGWEIAGTRQWTNSAKVPEEMYTSGDTVDLQLGTSGVAHTEAGEGDLRLSIGEFGGAPTAVLYRRVSDQKQPKTFNSGVFHNYVMDYVAVDPNVKITVTRGLNETTIEAAIPLADLALTATDGQSVRGDFGATYGDNAGQRTRLRVYWSNQHTGIVDDAVAELMMQPQYWGTITFAK